MRKLYLGVAGLLGAAVAAVPSIAIGNSPPNTASFMASDFKWQSAGGTTQVTIAQGGTVSFSYPTGSSSHNADFGGGAAPTSCTQTAGASSGAVPPLPHLPTSQGWSGSCTFNTPGTYTFHCDLHPFMTGTIVVQAPGGTTGTTGTTTTTTTGTTTITPGPTSPEPTVPITTTPHSGGPPAGDVVVSHHQHGRVLKGSLNVTTVGAGGLLVVQVFVHRHRGLLKVGNVRRRVRAAGTVRFSVNLHSLRHRHQLKLTVKLTLRPPNRSVFSKRITVLIAPGS